MPAEGQHPVRDTAQDAPLRVLLVDDTSDVRLLVRTLMADRTNMEVVAEAGDGQEAVELARALRPDLIVLDVAMPVLDGIAALPLLKEASPDSRVVMLSAFPHHRQAPAALAAGAAAYVEKGVATSSLVDELLSGAGLLDAAVRTLSEQAHRSFAADPRSVSASRRFVAGALAGWDESRLADTITLLLSELVTNAVVHANSAPDVTVRLLPDRVHVEVTDRSAGAVAARDLTEDQTGGRGLSMVDTLSMGWGSVALPGGKVVWFDVARGAEGPCAEAR